MSIFKCKMCGGTIEFNPGDTVGVCDSCGTKQTLPRLDDDRKANLYDRANHFRRNNDFDKAMGIYEQILNEDNTDAEAYWSLVLCRYGIEYVEDPATHKRVPTVNRAQYTSIFADEDYKSALKYADSYQRVIYEDEAKVIDDIQKGILEISQKEEPFDVFICYKETDNNGRRTQDSVLANDLYHQLTQEGFKAFFSRITLEDKLGTAYEPYIFAALNSAKVMVVLGTRPEYFNAVWVKNEWSRYLALVKKSGGKKLLVPAYKDMDPYDLPEEFSHLQAQDMSKLGFMQDLIRGIKKIIAADAPKETVKETVVVQQSSGNTTVNAQIKRGNMALEDHDWDKADSFFEEALNLDPECAEAYIGKLLAKSKKPGFDSWVAMQKEKNADERMQRFEACPENTEHISKKAKELAVAYYLDENRIRKEYVYDREYMSALPCRKNQKESQLRELANERLLTRTKQYAKGNTKKQIDDAMAAITAVLNARIDEANQQDEASIAEVKQLYAEHIEKADVAAEKLSSDAKTRRETDYENAVDKMDKAGKVYEYEAAIEALKAMKGYKNSEALAAKCVDEIKRITEAERKEAERKAEEQRIAEELAAKKRKKITIIAGVAACLCIVIVALITQVIIPNNKSNNAVALMNNGNYEEAIAAFDALNGYKDSTDQITECNYLKAVALMNNGNYEEAIVVFDALNEYKDSVGQILNCKELMLKNAEVGDYVWFGSYEQDNDTSNGKEGIEWLVLDKQGNKVLLLSRYGLDAQPYNTEYEEITWENCTLRTWLNETFINNAFSSAEQQRILLTDVYNSRSQCCSKWNTTGGNNTQDKIFLLSYAEANKYLDVTYDNDNNTKSRVAPTDYAIAQGAWQSDDFKTEDGLHAGGGGGGFARPASVRTSRLS
jgi:tetratricopeptide (TPR) repeat protein